ncbi:TetR/AcrR family transcriptional regulator [Verrucosispora sp. WMMA2044]|uniref:TetR/AcrR family transcriptional regulator n=1 Tax=Verrucosispora sioxanthis TaxID=2499994 RepID=A0A6M1L5D9_9ACTN|nr:MULTISPECIES: TetR/AcrR family transcriptional regulator [Micromonospora]NEE63254.1 TetR/AcrR family transcriptional regulator [Verrucosispora sioxanthis]NGM12364.1 TetR/AcrR family transcriptional regulator [Verrucosispora sioxanthis]WBB47765.1 TetR/AcrR family transcriptional regulator [Verrucosispora sp. WMMA2044]
MSTRDDLVAAATALLDEGGPEHVTLREVGRRAGVSHNAPYKHFTDKQALLEAVAAREFDRLGRAMTQPPSEETTAIELLHLVLLEYVRWAQRHPQRFELATSWPVPSASAELQLSAGNTWRRLVELTAEAQASGSLSGGDPERLAALARAVAHGAAHLAMTGHLARDGKGHASAEDLVNDVFAVLRR